MQIRTVVMTMAAACAIGISTGCVKQEDLDALEAKKNAEIDTLVAAHAEEIDTRDVEIKELSEKNDSLDNEISALKAEKLNLQSKVTSLETDVTGLESQVRSLTSKLTKAENDAAASAAKAAGMVDALDEAERLAAFHEKQYNTLRAAFIKLQSVDPAQYQADLGSVSDLDIDPDAVFNDIVAAAAAVNKTASPGEEVSPDELIKELLNDMGNM
ncbi:MAG: hypothetical protein JXR40_04815 [Pontiellaceae bacterium]|nr:hypothetical protein [Pontiellaceae bacterium]